MRTLIMVLLVVMGLDITGCRSGQTGPSSYAMSIERPAPDFELTALDGSTVKLSALRDKHVLLAFWGFGCAPCRVEAPHLSTLAEKYADKGLVVLGINGWDDPREVVAAYQEKNNFKHTLLLNGSEVAKAYGIDLYPSCIWVNKQGIITDIQYGATNAKKLETKTEKLLQAK